MAVRPQTAQQDSNGNWKVSTVPNAHTDVAGHVDATVPDVKRGTPDTFVIRDTRAVG